MTKKVEVIIKDAQDKEIATYKTKTLTKLFNKLKQDTRVKIFIKEDGLGEQFNGDYVVKGLDNEPLPPDMNEPPIIQIQTPMNGTVNTDVVMKAQINDPDGQVIDTEWKQLTGAPVAIIVKEDGEYSGTFKPTEVGQYSFLLNAFDNKGAKVGQEIIVNVSTSTTEPPPGPGPTEPPTGEELYNSQKHSKLHDGKVRTIKQEGSLAPNGLGIECRASGNPRIQVNADNTFSLICDAGHGRYYLYCNQYNSTMELEAAFWNEAAGQDISKKKRSRHNEGGACENRFGGYGESSDRSGWGGKRETCHNIHDQSESGSLPSKMETKKYNVFRFTVKDEGGKVRQIAEMDGKKYMDKLDSSPKPYMVDLQSFMKPNQSYEWVRQNIDSGTGEIRIKRHRILKA